MARPGDIVTCKNGHHYDVSKHTECPVCKQERERKEVGVTRGDNSMYAAKPRYASRPMNTVADMDGEETVAAVQVKMGFSPVVGWLVSVDGTNKGKDYRIVNGRNFIGRERTMDVCIPGDNTISRQQHAIISYDDRANKYYYSPGMARSIDHINEEPVFATVELKAGDLIEVGTTKLRFVPLCSAKFRWEDWNEAE